MLNRRAFIHAAALALPLASCGSPDKPPQETSLGSLTPEQMQVTRRNAAQFESALEAVRRADVPYGVEPRFFLSV